MTQQGYQCYQSDDEGCNALTEAMFFCENAAYCWKSTFRAENGTELYARGCVTKSEHARLVCSNLTQTSETWAFRTECCAGDLCNNGTFPVLDPLISTGRGIGATEATLLILAQVLTLMFILGIAIYYRLEQKSRFKKYQQERHETTKVKPIGNVAPSAPELTITAVGESTLKDYLEGNLSSGSNSSRPSKKKRTLFQQITLVEHLNAGNFGHKPELWRGIWMGCKNVAVKIYPSRAESTWAHETKIFAKPHFRHDNLLGYVGGDVTSVAGCTQLWLVTDYQPNGSLRDYLRQTTLTRNEMLRMCLGLASGLFHLHSEIEGTKVCIAHRNLSSKHVFVDGNGKCVIGGFELAVTQEEVGKVEFFEHADKRYMGPEFFEPTASDHSTWSMDDFRRADIYSLGLVLWEICRRCVGNEDDVALEYEVPFAEFGIEGDLEPSVEEMRKLIVTHDHRPEIPEEWQSDEVMAWMITVIGDCWRRKAAMRSPILQVTKMIMELAKN